ncbi:hypothetical protein M758_1G322700 [Ceratodon purpureus]|uniref:Uncharacterized protein n=1 Tax=Ceratodon purpureus TaxID=3225 RepID=A0A8T0JC08_CERPU|nr:hypothetical protein KC19_1G330100 [Ceratodon purpureus]KAG0632372.1 hypothetical protein M758_1G322700 [Ceratodon purpureus]
MGLLHFLICIITKLAASCDVFKKIFRVVHYLILNVQPVQVRLSNATLYWQIGFNQLHEEMFTC